MLSINCYDTLLGRENVELIVDEGAKGTGENCLQNQAEIGFYLSTFLMFVTKICLHYALVYATPAARNKTAQAEPGLVQV